MSYYEFHFGNALTLAQLVSSLCFMHIMKKMHLIDYKSFNKNIAKQVCSAVKQARTLSFRVRRVVMCHHFLTCVHGDRSASRLLGSLCRWLC